MEKMGKGCYWQRWCERYCPYWRFAYVQIIQTYGRWVDRENVQPGMKPGTGYRLLYRVCVIAKSGMLFFSDRVKPFLIFAKQPTAATVGLWKVRGMSGIKIRIYI